MARMAGLWAMLLNDERVRLGRWNLAARRIGQVREFVRIIVTTTRTRFVREGEGLRYKSTWQTLQPRYACTRAQRRFAGESQKVSCDLTRESSGDRTASSEEYWWWASGRVRNCLQRRLHTCTDDDEMGSTDERPGRLN
jgi:hypothetical protein